MGRFLWRYGVLWFGGLFFATNTVIRWLSNNPDQRYDYAMVSSLVAVSLAYSLSVGAAAGIAAWYGFSAIARMLRHREVRSEAVLAKSQAAANK
jgi:hypothetical protein